MTISTEFGTIIIVKKLRKTRKGSSMMKELNKTNWDKVNVKNHWGGWYSFSPSGHAYYNGNDELLIRGKKALVETLNDYHVLGVGRDVYKDTEIIYNN